VTGVAVARLGSDRSPGDGLHDRVESLPRHWRPTRLKYLFDSITGGTWGSDPDGGDDDLVCVRVADFDRSRFAVTTTALTTRAVTSTERRSRALRPGDLLLEKSGGGDQQPVGFVVLFDHGFPAVCSNFIAKLRPAAEHHPRFLSYLFAGLYAARANVPFIKQTTGIQNLDVGAFLGQRWKVPPLAEQRAIASHLDNELEQLDRVATLKRRLFRLLDERLGGVISAELRDVPRTTRLGTCGTWLSGGTPPKDDLELWDGTVPWATSKDLGVYDLADTEDHITERASRTYTRVVPPNSLLIATRGMALAKRLPVALAVRSMAFNQDLKALVPARHVDPRYLLYTLRGLEAEVLSLTDEAAHGTKRLETARLRRFQIPLPELRDQNRIVATLDKELAETAALRDQVDGQLALVREHRGAVVFNAITGRTRE
jgi:type I restriction enzyme, S subunit